MFSLWDVRAAIHPTSRRCNVRPTWATTCFAASTAVKLTMTVAAHHSTSSKSPPTSSFRSCLCRVRYKLSYRDVAELSLRRGFQFTHETVRDWEERFLPHFTDRIRTKRKGKVGKVWLVDETYVRIKGVWCYLYRGIDKDGNLVDVRLSKMRDMAATKAFFA